MPPAKAIENRKPSEDHDRERHIGAKEDRHDARRFSGALVFRDGTDAKRLDC